MKNWFRRTLVVLRIVLGLALLFYVLVVQGHWTAARDLVAARWLFPTLVVLTLFGAVIEAMRLALLCRSQGIRLSFSVAFRLVTVAAFLQRLRSWRHWRGCGQALSSGIQQPR